MKAHNTKKILMPVSPFVTAIFRGPCIAITELPQGTFGHQTGRSYHRVSINSIRDPLSVCHQGYGFSGLLSEVKPSGERSEWLRTPREW